ncbi:MAG: SRPBCC domain-containing protein [Bacteroidetes bacterium]|nr:SRPBCC domain-containing protein [Bacteroidota bacterium]
MKDVVIIVETFNAPVERVWEAITDKDKMKMWYFDLDEFKAQVGFSFRFPGSGHKGESYIHICEVTEVVVHKRLQYSWRYENLDGISFVTFELFADGAETRLKLTHTGLDSFPSHPDFARESFSSGWSQILHTSLKRFIDETQTEN